MSWLDLKTSLYKCQADNFGRPATFGDILLTEFAIEHKWFYNNDNFPANGSKWITGKSNDLKTITTLRNIDRSAENYDTAKSLLKSTLQSFTPSALLKTKKKDCVEEINRTGIMQLDFDYKAICQYDIEELKERVFSLPFICYCGLSCSGDGFYALALIAEPEKLSEYAEHCFFIFEKNYGIMVDTTKGKQVHDLRYVSYDSRMLIRENPVPLKVNTFKRKEALQKQPVKLGNTIAPNANKLVMSELTKVCLAKVGNRWKITQQVSFTLGGLNNPSLLNLIKEQILLNREFEGEEEKYLKCAEYCFEEGMKKPITAIK